MTSQNLARSAIFLANNAKYFPQERIGLIKSRLDSLDEDAF